MPTPNNAPPAAVGLAPAVAITAAAYLLLGIGGLSLAIAPGYVSPIFPASGFAVAAMLWSGGRAWAGIWLGSFLLNLWAAWNNSMLDMAAAGLAAGIAAGATAQAWVADRLVRRYTGEGWQTMMAERDIIVCLVLAGPLACLVSASTGVLLLRAGGVVPPGETLFAWWNWWSGDTLGAMVMLPLGLTLLLRRMQPWRARLTTLGIPMVTALLLVGGSFFAVSGWEQHLAREQVQRHAAAMGQLVQQRIISHEASLSALRRLIVVSPDMSYPDFEYFTRITLKDNPDIFALSINPYVTREKRPAFEKTYAARTGTPAFQVTERDAQRALVRAGDRADHVAVAYIAPLEGNRPAVGYDIYSEPVRRAALDRAMETQAPAVTAPIRLVQEKRERTGVLVLHPAYLPGAPTGKPHAFAVGVIKIEEMMDIATRGATVDGLVLQLEDRSAGPETALMHRTSPAQVKTIGRMRAESTLRIADRTWTLSVEPTAAYLRQQPHWMAMVAGAGGLALATLLQVLLLVTTGRTALVQRTVREQTAELEVRGAALEDRNAQLDALFSLSPDGLVAFGPDDHVTFVNPAFKAMTGIDPGDVIGRSGGELEAALRRQMEAADKFPGLESLFDAAGEPIRHGMLTMRLPQAAVLQVMGIRSRSPSVTRLLYLRDVTHETEVARLKSEFLSHAAHELRTPMSSILGFSELLVEMDLDEPTRKDLLQTIHRQTLWLVEIINELLDLSRIESRRGQDIRIAEVDLGGLVQAAVASLGLDASLWPVRVEAPAAPVRVRADEAKLRQALLNVLGNARKYSPAGGAISIRYLARDGRRGVLVEDRGIGMTAKQLGHFGERFWRADTSGKTPGTGLGVAIVKEILALLDGSLEVDSVPGEGTRVTLWLPAAGDGSGEETVKK